MLGKLRMTAGSVESTNQQEYNRLHAVGPAVNFAADAAEPLTRRQSDRTRTECGSAQPSFERFPRRILRANSDNCPTGASLRIGGKRRSESSHKEVPL